MFYKDRLGGRFSKKLTRAKKTSQLNHENSDGNPILCICVVPRYSKRGINVGLRPLSYVNNVFIKATLGQAEFDAETFVVITDDFDLDLFN